MLYIDRLGFYTFLFVVLLDIECCLMYVVF